MVYLDAVLSGSENSTVNNISISSKEMEMLCNLMEWKLGKHLNMNKYPKYIYDTFDCFCKHKKEITLCLYYLNKMNKDIIDLVMYNIEKSTKKEREISDKTNLFRKQILDIFENVKNIRIMCGYGKYSYSLSLLGLLTLIESSGIQQVVIEVARLTYNIDLGWVYNVKEQYEQKNYKINTSKNEQYDLITIDKL